MLSTISLESSVRRILVEKRQGFDLEARDLKKDLIESLHIDTIENIRILNRYDIEGIDSIKTAAQLTECRCFVDFIIPLKGIQLLFRS